METSAYMRERNICLFLQKALQNYFLYGILFLIRRKRAAFIAVLSKGENMEGTFWAFLPAIIAIVLALITKQVYVSLFFGIFVGAMMYAGGDPLKALFTLYQVMSEKVGGNTPIIVFLVVLCSF